MPSVLTEAEYNQIYRLLGGHQANNDDIIASIQHSVFASLNSRQAFLDVGAGTGYITSRVSSNFELCEIIEPSSEFSADLIARGYHVQALTFQEAILKRKYDFVLCSHVLYNVELSEWPHFLDKLIGCVESGGMATIVMVGSAGAHHDICHAVNPNYKNSVQVIEHLRKRKLSFEIEQVTSRHPASCFSEMYNMCKFAILEDCLTAEKYHALSPFEKQMLDDKIKQYAENNKREDGTYRLDALTNIIHVNVKNKRRLG